MYNELYTIWKREIESIELEKLPSDFYLRLAAYARKLQEESRMLDRRTTKASLLKREMRNVKFMVRDLIRTRHAKFFRKAINDEKVSPDTLTAEEEKIYSQILSSAEAYNDFIVNVLRGYTPTSSMDKKHKRVVLRFLRDIPAIVGVDLKPYGSFKVEDIATLPIENAKVLVNQGLAEKVEVR